MSQMHINNAAGIDLYEFEKSSAIFETLPTDLEQTTEDDILLTDKKRSRTPQRARLPQ